MVAGPEEHEAAWPHHRFELGPGFLGIFPCGERLVRFLVELPQLLFKALVTLSNGFSATTRTWSTVMRVTFIGLPPWDASRDRS